MSDIQRNLNTKRATLPARKARAERPRIRTEQSQQQFFTQSSAAPPPKKSPKRGVLIGCFVFIALIVTVPIAITSIFSDDDRDGDKTTEVSKDGAVEVVFSSKHVDATTDILVAHYRIYKNNANILEYDVLDTVPALGTTRKEVEDAKGDRTMQDVPNEYDLYVTVK